MFAFVGSRTTQARNARGHGLSVYEVDSGRPWRLRQVVELINPSYLLVDPERRTLYTVHGDQSDIRAYSVCADGALTLLNQRSTRGRNPVHLAWNERCTHLVIANYATGSLSGLPVAPDGTLGESTATLAFEGSPGPRRQDQTGAHPHQVLRWPGTDRFVVPDKGLDRLHLVELDGSGRLHRCGEWPAAPGAGCRHAVLDPSRRLLWVVNELDASVTTWRVDLAGRRAEAVQTVSLLPPRHAGHSTGAGIVRRGDWLYVSIRGLDAVASLRIDPGTGRLALAQSTSTRGATPRFITLTPDERQLVVANEGGDNVWQFDIRDDGLLGDGVEVVRTGSPVCVAFLTGFVSSERPR